MTGKQTVERFDQLEALRLPHEYLWQETAWLMNSRNYNGRGNVSGYVPHNEIYDTTLRTKSRMQANGITSMLYPRDRDWLVMRPAWEDRKNLSLEKVYREAGEAVMHYLRSSNFHTVNHRAIFDRSQLGTGTMRMKWENDDQGEDIMNFCRFDPMNYVIDHDHAEKVDTFGACYKWPAYRAAAMWGKENLSSKLQREVEDPQRRSTTHDFLVVIEKQPKWKLKKEAGNKGMAYTVRVVERDSKHEILDSGNDHFEIVSSRYEVDGSPWGYCPAHEILPDAYKANYAGKFMMVMGERAAVPPVMAPSYMKEEGVGLGAAEVNYYAETSAAGKNPVYELSGGGNYQVGMDIWRKLQDSIDEAYHGHLFNMFNRSERDMTATEANMRREELNAQANPTLTALEQDHTKPIVGWAFNSLVERGVIELPDEAYNEVTGKPRMPQFAFDNTFTSNHKRSKAVEAMGMMDAIVNMAAADGRANVHDIKKIQTRIWRDLGQDEDDLLSEDEYQEQQEAQQQAAQQAQMAEMAQTAGGLAKDLSSVEDPEAMLGALS